MPSGRKTLKDEIGVLKRYNELSAAYFAVIKEHLESKSKADRQWAVERLDKAFVKMLPQKIEGPGENGELQVQIINYGNAPLQLPTSNLSTSSTPGD